MIRVYLQQSVNISLSMIPANGVEPAADLSPGQSLGNALGLGTLTNLWDIGGYKTENGPAVVRGLLLEYPYDRIHLPIRQNSNTRGAF